MLFCAVPGLWQQPAEAAGKAAPEGQRIPYAHRSVSRTTFVAFDTETTGLSPAKERIVELAAVKYLDGRIVEEKSWLINPGRPIPGRATEVHGISDEMVSGAPDFADIYPAFLDFIDDSVLLAHNARFDVNFMKEEMRRSNIEPPRNRVIDTLALYRTWFPGLDSYRLEALVGHFDIKGEGFHRALADAKYTILLLKTGLKDRDEDLKLGDLYEQAGNKVFIF